MDRRFFGGALYAPAKVLDHCLEDLDLLTNSSGRLLLESPSFALVASTLSPLCTCFAANRTGPLDNLPRSTSARTLQHEVQLRELEVGHPSLRYALHLTLAPSTVKALRIPRQLEDNQCLAQTGLYVHSSQIGSAPHVPASLGHRVIGETSDPRTEPSTSTFPIPIVHSTTLWNRCRNSKSSSRLPGLRQQGYGPPMIPAMVKVRLTFPENIV